jgi:serine phosphatase RsbU (regulator of sigma subunit)
MTIVYYATDVFQLGTVGGPKYAQVFEVTENSYGDTLVRHSDGETECDDGTEVWALSE